MSFSTTVIFDSRVKNHSAAVETIIADVAIETAYNGEGLELNVASIAELGIDAEVLSLKASHKEAALEGLYFYDKKLLKIFKDGKELERGAEDVVKQVFRLEITIAYNNLVRAAAPNLKVRSQQLRPQSLVTPAPVAVPRAAEVAVEAPVVAKTTSTKKK